MMASSRWSLKTLAHYHHQHSKQETAQMFLRDVALRLEEQTEALPTNHTSFLRNKKDQNVVRAVNQNVSLSFREDMIRRQRMERAFQQVDKSLHDLRVLHDDTRNLVQHLLSLPSSFWDSFQDSVAKQHVVTATMEQIRSRHAATVETMADIVLLLRSNPVEPWLRGRFGVQLLCDHYVGLDKRPHGGVSIDCDLVQDVLVEAITEAKHVCDAHYQFAPEVIVEHASSHATCTLIRPWVHHALTEVLKNAMSATIQRHGTSSLPPIVIQLEEDGLFWRLNVRDQGTGCADPAEAFGFATSSSGKRWDRLEEQQSYASVRSPLQSLGVGLPMSRWMMQHFGGDLHLNNNNNNNNDLGCTASILLCRDDSVLEHVPYY